LGETSQIAIFIVMFTSLISHDTNGLFIGDTSGNTKTCLAGTVSRPRQNLRAGLEIQVVAD
jgi:hypothetical protein